MSDILNGRMIQLEDFYKKRYLKRIDSKPKPVWILARRTFATAISILVSLDTVPFDTLVRSIYVYCKDSSLNWMTREYEKQIELAGANPERFVFQLHSFYNDISHKIRKNKLYAELMDFMGTYMELAYLQMPGVNKGVVNAFGNLLMQTMEYIRLNKFDFTQSVIGVATDGKPICAPQLHPDWDLPGYEAEEGIQSGRIQYDGAIKALTEIYAKYGYAVNSVQDILEISEIQKLQDSTTAALMPYINEFTYDIFPQRYYNTWDSPLLRMDTDVGLRDLTTALKARKKTLPRNGTRIVFDDPAGEVRELLLKEVVKNNAVVMLYRLTTKNGDIAGYFNTRNEFLYSINAECTQPGAYQKTKKFVLYCYAACVTSRFPVDGNAIFNAGSPVTLRIYGIGGKLRAAYAAGESGNGGLRHNDPDMESETREINGYIRKLPDGQRASEDAIMIARQMGYALDPGETYVRPFCKEVFVKRTEEPHS